VWNQRFKGCPLCEDRFTWLKMREGWEVLREGKRFRQDRRKRLRSGGISVRRGVHYTRVVSLSRLFSLHEGIEPYTFVSRSEVNELVLMCYPFCGDGREGGSRTDFSLFLFRVSTIQGSLFLVDFPRAFRDDGEMF
jgi:hypothetical protein